MEQPVSSPLNASARRWPCENRLKPAQRLVMAALLLPLGLFFVLAIDARVRAAGQDEPSVQWVRCLDLSGPCLWPSGTPQRHPMSLPAGLGPGAALAAAQAPPHPGPLPEGAR